MRIPEPCQESSLPPLLILVVVFFIWEASWKTGGGALEQQMWALLGHLVSIGHNLGRHHGPWAFLEAILDHLGCPEYI